MKNFIQDLPMFSIKIVRVRQLRSKFSSQISCENFEYLQVIENLMKTLPQTVQSMLSKVFSEKR